MNPSSEFFDALLLELPGGHTLLWLLFGAVALYAVIHAIVFWYHWHRYNIASLPFRAWTYLLYFGGVIVFLGITFLSVVSLTS